MHFKEYSDSGQHLEMSNPMVGGTAFNAALAFSQKGFFPIIIGNVGNDAEGQYIQKTIKEKKLSNIIHKNPNKPTGTCHIFYSDSGFKKGRHFIRNKNDANVYDLRFLTAALESVRAEKDELIFIASDFFVRQDISDCQNMLEAISEKSTKVILDVVPHSIYKKLRLQEFKSIIDDRVYVMIAELKTLMRFFDKDYSKDSPQFEDWDRIFANFNPRFVVIRYGVGEISKQEIRKYSDTGKIMVLQAEINTGYEKLNNDFEKRGFGDILTANFLASYYQELQKQCV